MEWRVVWATVIGLALVLAACDDGSADGGLDADVQDEPLPACTADDECDDGAWCTGEELCAPGAPGADTRGCLASEAGPCAPSQRCDEAGRFCQTDCAADPDADDDGHDAESCGGDDCDDADGLRYPGNTEVCDAGGHDEDCDPATLGGPLDGDADGDGHVGAGCCHEWAPGELVCGEDCDDASAEINPEAPESCNGVDDDCSLAPTAFDADGDGHEVPACNGDDCNDGAPTVYPGALEFCDGYVSDCAVDGGGSDRPEEDADGDRFAPEGAPCVVHPAIGLDCDDGDATLNPGATEVCDGIDDDCNGAIDDGPGCHPDAAWSFSLGGHGLDLVNGVAVDAFGDVFVTGTFTDTVSCGDSTITSISGTDIFVASFEPDGACRWATSYGAAAPPGGRVDEGRAIAVDSAGTVAVTGSFSGGVDFGDATRWSGTSMTDVFVLALDAASGDTRWSQAFGGTGVDQGTSVAIDGDGAIYVVGTYFGMETPVFTGSVLAGLPCQTASTGFVARLDTGGGRVWSRCLGSYDLDASGNVYVTGVAVDAFGGVYVTGSWNDAVYFDCTHDGCAAPSEMGESYVVTFDVFVASYTAGGDYVAVQGFGNLSTDEHGKGIAVDADGDVYVTGTMWGDFEFGGDSLVVTGATDAFVAAIGRDGEPSWARNVGGSGLDAGNAIAIDGDGNLVLAGYFQDEFVIDGVSLRARGAGDMDLLVMSIGADRSLRWAQGFGSDWGDQATAAAVAPSGDVVFGGYFSLDLTVNGATHTNQGDADALLIQLE